MIFRLTSFAGWRSVRETPTKAVACFRLRRCAKARIGGKRPELAAWTGRPLRDWFHRFNAEGPDGLLDHCAPPRKSRLSETEMAELSAIVEAGPDLQIDGVVRWRRIDLQAVIAKRFGVQYHERYVGKLLEKLGFSHVSAHPRHTGQDARIVEEYKKTSLRC